MKRGHKVIVACGGKLMRSTIGTVTKTRNGHHIKVRFIPWTTVEDKISVEKWFRFVNKGREALNDER